MSLRIDQQPLWPYGIPSDLTTDGDRELPPNVIAEIERVAPGYSKFLTRPRLPSDDDYVQFSRRLAACREQLQSYSHSINVSDLLAGGTRPQKPVIEAWEVDNSILVGAEAPAMTLLEPPPGVHAPSLALVAGYGGAIITLTVPGFIPVDVGFPALPGDVREFFIIDSSLICVITRLYTEVSIHLISTPYSASMPQSLGARLANYLGAERPCSRLLQFTAGRHYPINYWYHDEVLYWTVPQHGQIWSLDLDALLRNWKVQHETADAQIPLLYVNSLRDKQILTVLRCCRTSRSTNPRYPMRSITSVAHRVHGKDDIAIIGTADCMLRLIVNGCPCGIYPLPCEPCGVELVEISPSCEFVAAVSALGRLFLLRIVEAADYDESARTIVQGQSDDDQAPRLDSGFEILEGEAYVMHCLDLQMVAATDLLLCMGHPGEFDGIALQPELFSARALNVSDIGVVVVASNFGLQITQTLYEYSFLSAFAPPDSVIGALSTARRMKHAQIVDGGSGVPQLALLWRSGGPTGAKVGNIIPCFTRQNHEDFTAAVAPLCQLLQSGLDLFRYAQMAVGSDFVESCVQAAGSESFLSANQQTLVNSQPLPVSLDAQAAPVRHFVSQYIQALAETVEPVLICSDDGWLTTVCSLTGARQAMTGLRGKVEWPIQSDVSAVFTELSDAVISADGSFALVSNSAGSVFLLRRSGLHGSLATECGQGPSNGWAEVVAQSDVPISKGARPAASSSYVPPSLTVAPAGRAEDWLQISSPPLAMDMNAIPAYNGNHVVQRAVRVSHVQVCTQFLCIALTPNGFHIPDTPMGHYVAVTLVPLPSASPLILTTQGFEPFVVKPACGIAIEQGSSGPGAVGRQPSPRFIHRNDSLLRSDEAAFRIRDRGQFYMCVRPSASGRYQAALRSGAITSSQFIAAFSALYRDDQTREELIDAIRDLINPNERRRRSSRPATPREQPIGIGSSDSEFLQISSSSVSSTDTLPAQTSSSHILSESELGFEPSEAAEETSVSFVPSSNLSTETFIVDDSESTPVSQRSVGRGTRRQRARQYTSSSSEPEYSGSAHFSDTSTPPPRSAGAPSRPPRTSPPNWSDAFREIRLLPPQNPACAAVFPQQVTLPAVLYRSFSIYSVLSITPPLGMWMPTPGDVMVVVPELIAECSGWLDDTYDPEASHKPFTHVTKTYFHSFCSDGPFQQDHAAVVEVTAVTPIITSYDGKGMRCFASLLVTVSALAENSHLLSFYPRLAALQRATLKGSGAEATLLLPLPTLRLSSNDTTPDFPLVPAAIIEAQLMSASSGSAREVDLRVWTRPTCVTPQSVVDRLVSLTERTPLETAGHEWRLQRRTQTPLTNTASIVVAAVSAVLTALTGAPSVSLSAVQSALVGQIFHGDQGSFPRFVSVAALPHLVTDRHGTVRQQSEAATKLRSLGVSSTALERLFSVHDMEVIAQLHGILRPFLPGAGTDTGLAVALCHLAICVRALTAGRIAAASGDSSVDSLLPDFIIRNNETMKTRGDTYCVLVGGEKEVHPELDDFLGLVFRVISLVVPRFGERVVQQELFNMQETFSNSVSKGPVEALNERDKVDARYTRPKDLDGLMDCFSVKQEDNEPRPIWSCVSGPQAIAGAIALNALQSRPDRITQTDMLLAAAALCSCLAIIPKETAIDLLPQDQSIEPPLLLLAGQTTRPTLAHILLKLAFGVYGTRRAVAQDIDIVCNYVYYLRHGGAIPEALALAGLGSYPFTPSELDPYNVNSLFRNATALYLTDYREGLKGRIPVEERTEAVQEAYDSEDHYAAQIELACLHLSLLGDAVNAAFDAGAETQRVSASLEHKLSLVFQDYLKKCREISSKA